MKQIGIITLLRGENYGNRLQNYAVQQNIGKMGYTVSTIRNTTMKGFDDTAIRSSNIYKKLTPHHITKYLHVRLNAKFGCKNDRDFSLIRLIWSRQNQDKISNARQERIDSFANFNDTFIQFSDFTISIRDLPKRQLDQFHAFVCGSDQIWNPFYPQTSMIDFLQFAPEYKRIAFSPSFGVSEIPARRLATFTNWLGGIPSVSAREAAGAKIVRELIGRDVPVLLDPTFLLSADEWRKIERRPKHMPAYGYILCYFLGNRSRTYSKAIRDIASRFDFEIVDIFDLYDLRYYACDPGEFLYLIDHAAFVCTDSFHGIAFSVIFKKAFLAFERIEGGHSMGSRIQNILSLLDLTDRRFPYSGDWVRISEMDYSHVDAILEKEKVKAIDYLKKSLDQVDSEKQNGRNKPVLAHSGLCTGCAACIAICPTHCIEMIPDQEGFPNPRVDETSCMQCGKCEHACPVLNVKKYDRPLPNAFAMYANDIRICRSSSSGGIFSLLAKQVIRDGGVVFGAGFDQKFDVCHQYIDDMRNIGRLQTSKYVQSAIGQTYQQAEDFLKEGRPVLFSGTPCQIQGLINYLSKPYGNLIAQDIICHGVPSPKAWRKYLDEFAASDIRYISFRDKTAGWNNFGMRIETDNRLYHEPASKDPFLKAFLNNLCLRPSCHHCHFKTINRAADITLADFWGVERVIPEWKGQQGVSLVLTHSEKGKAYLDKCMADANARSIEAMDGIKYNHAALNSVPMPARRTRFFENLETVPFSKLVNVCSRPGIVRWSRRTIRKTLSKAKRRLAVIKT